MEFGTNQVIVTGALGWLGRAFVAGLVNGISSCDRLREPQKGLRIRCLELPGQDISFLEQLSQRIEVFIGDLGNPNDCKRLCEDSEGAILFHLAGIIHPGRVRKFYQVHVDGTRNILEAAIQSGVRRAIVVSSNSPIGTNPNKDSLFDESSPYHPYMHYGRSKMIMEQIAMEASQSGRIETVIIRPQWFYGPYQPPRQTLFFKMIRDGRAPIIGGGENRRSMAFIDNVAQGVILAALQPKANGQIYWIADERAYTMNEIVDTVERLLEAEFDQECMHKRLRLPGFVSELAWLADWVIQTVGLYHQKIHVLSEMNKTIACSVDKAKRELGYAPTVTLEEGMRQSLTWIFREYGGLQ